jgi:hypothetical protein
VPRPLPGLSKCRLWASEVVALSISLKIDLSQHIFAGFTLVTHKGRQNVALRAAAVSGVRLPLVLIHAGISRYVAARVF